MTYLADPEAQVRFGTRQISSLVSGLEEGPLRLTSLEPQYLLKRPIGSSPKWREVIETANDAAEYDGITILILGETGTGKEVIAEAIHARSSRRRGPLVKVHCAALHESLLSSELFGHERGAFTGAVSQRKGRFEQASGGTLFLDEVGQIPLSVQVKLLRVLQEKTFERVGSSATIKADFRLISATNRDLEADVKAGRFREDLYYRLHVFPIKLPPLRDREEDIPLLAEHFIAKLNSSNGKRVQGFSPDALERLRRYPFPGNVRELENLIARCWVRCRGARIELQDLPDSARAPVEAQEHADDPLSQLWRGELDWNGFERRILQQAMQRAGGVQTVAANRLGITRRKLQCALKKHGLLK
jgi:transcriptional regulator with GAF, ATPase, and Fis domain